ncbi:MAG: deoxyribodipyrimidine photo-lyase [Candidatus ainarchaeum sp.]|nr:deoxyribodipyrimidine photo-lyase [Candidatus ainarchaeum sp.]MDD3976310.1 deoxyribodipyrimidine photo-lyase [Candidatus ainarchaeum sp.]
MIFMNRLRILKEKDIKKGKDIVYWMSRDQRVKNNWSLIYAQNLAKKYNLNLKVIFCLVKDFLKATDSHYTFMLEGLKLVENDLFKKNISFELLICKDISNDLLKYIKENTTILLTDFDPLKIKKEWKKQILKDINCSFYEVDSHNIIPVWTVSEKQEYGAYTIRPKLNKLLPLYLEDFPKIRKEDKKIKKPNVNWAKLIDLKKKNKYFESGEFAASMVLKNFIIDKFEKYYILRNDPSINYISNLSMYLHFGQISSQQIALEINKLNNLKYEQSKSYFLEELIIRKELSDNFCNYNKDYDNFNGFPNWAKETLKKHENDKRKYIYSLKDLENYKTHDPLWNASQKELVLTGKMHGYLRMYWAKKILEWTKDSKEAQKISIYLNNKFEMDGRDPNGYTGIAWAIGGVHDRAWFERDIFGKIRYMSFNNTSKKFDYKKYIENVNNLDK